MRIYPFLLLCFPLFAADSFITMEEYARQLYHNPRGIGCFHCHGEKGEGLTVAKYKHRKEERVFAGPPIRSVDYETFAKALEGRMRGMPRYFLTDSEIKALYFYVQRKNRPESKEKADGGK